MVCKEEGGPGVVCDGSERRMGAVTPGETLGTLYNIRVGTNKTKQHTGTDTDRGGGRREEEFIRIQGYCSTECISSPSAFELATPAETRMGSSKSKFSEITPSCSGTKAR